MTHTVHISLCVCVCTQDWYWYSLISYCISNGAYTGCDPPDVGLPVHQQSVAVQEDNEPMVDHSVETGDAASSQDYSALENTRICDNSETVQLGVTTSLQENGFVAKLPDLIANKQTGSKLQLDGPHKQQPDTAQSSDRLTAVVNDNCLPDAVTEVTLDTAECSDESAVTVNGNRLLDAIAEVVSCSSEETVESCRVNLDSKLPVMETAMAENCALVSVTPPVNMLSASSLPSANVQPSAAGCVPEYALDNDTVKQFGCEMDNTTAEHARDELTSAHSSPQCLDVSYSELTGDSVAAAAVTKQLDQSDVLHCDIDDREVGIKTSSSDYLAANCSVDPKAQVAVTEQSLQAIIKPLETSNYDFMLDNCSADLEAEAAETEQSIRGDVLHSDIDDEAEIKTSETNSHDYQPDNCSVNPEAEAIVAEQSFHSVVSHCDMDDDAGVKTPEGSISDYLSANCSVDPVVHSIVNSAEKSDADHGWNGNPSKNELVFCANKKSSYTFDQISAVLVVNGDQSAECCGTTNTSNSNCSNSMADNADLHVTAAAAKNTADISRSVNVSVAANSEVQLSTPAVTTDKRTHHISIAEPVNVELQQKIIRQMEVSVYDCIKV